MTIRDRLVNFGRYWRDSRGNFNHCRSIEHRYVPGEDERALYHAEQVQEERASRPPAPDMQDAIIVHAAWQKCSPLTKRLLKWSFCMGRVTDEFVCRRCRIREEALPLQFYKAMKEIERILDTPNGIGVTLARKSGSSADTRHPAYAETLAPSAVRATAKETEDID